MQAKLARAQSQLDALLNNAERAVEAYNGALYQLDQAKAAAAAAQARADAAAASVAAAQREVGRFAAASYRMGGGIASFASMLDADGPQDLIDQASALANVAASNDRALDEVAAARVVAAVLDEQAAAALEAQTAAAERVRLAKVEAEAKVARRRFPDRRPREAHPAALGPTGRGPGSGRVALGSSARTASPARLGSRPPRRPSAARRPLRQPTKETTARTAPVTAAPTTRRTGRRPSSAAPSTAPWRGRPRRSPTRASSWASPTCGARADPTASTAPD